MTALIIFMAFLLLVAIFYDFSPNDTKKNEETTEKHTIPTITGTEPTAESTAYINNLIYEIGCFFAKRNDDRPYSELYKFRDSTVQIESGLFYGFTSYTGNTNQNGKHEVAFNDKDGKLIYLLQRRKWNDYEVEVGIENAPWLGISCGESIDVLIFQGNIGKEKINNYVQDYVSMLCYEGLCDALQSEVEKLNLPNTELSPRELKEKDKSPYPYVNRYNYVGGQYHVTSAFVSFGWAIRERGNKYNDKAIALKTVDGILLGYVKDNQLDDYYKETNGLPTPVVVVGIKSDTYINGYVYTFNNTASEYPSMIEQYQYCVDNYL